MASKNPETVAKKVIAKVRKGEKVVLGELIRESGYSEGISKQPNRITKQESFKQAIKPLAEGLDREIERIKRELSTRDLSEEKYSELARSLDILIKNYQLLTGKPTESIDIGVNTETLDKATKAINDYLGNIKK